MRGSYLEVTLARTSRPGCQLAWAGDLPEGDAGVVGTLEPVEAPVTARLELVRERVASGTGRHATVLGAPAVCRRSPFAGAAVVDADATTGDLPSHQYISQRLQTNPWPTHCQVKVILAEVTTSIGDLHHHGLARDRATGECELIALTAPLTLATTSQLGRREAIAQVGIDGPWALVTAAEGAAVTLAARTDIGVAGQRVVIDVARCHELAIRHFAAPSARRFAAVPIPGCLACAGFCGFKAAAHKGAGVDERGQVHIFGRLSRRDTVCG
jgi:hypothetical protein